MKIIGNIGGDVETKYDKNGIPFYTFQFAENIGTGENRTTTWYSVSARVSEEVGESLKRGDFLELTGKLSIAPFIKKDGTAGAYINVSAFSVKPGPGKRDSAPKSEST